MGKDIDVAKLLPKQLDEYVREKHTQEECVGFIDGFEKAIDLVKNGYLHAVSCSYLVYLDVDYEGIQDEMYLFKSKKKAIDKMNELNSSPEKWDGEEYRVKKLNCN